MISPNNVGTTGAAKAGKTGVGTVRQAGQATKMTGAAAKSAQAARTGRTAVKQGRVAVKAGSRSVKTAHTAAKTARKAQKSARTAKIAAQRAAKAAKKSVEAAKQTAKFTAHVVSSVVRGVVFILSGGLGFLLPVLLIVALIAAIVASPFGIFFSGQDSGPDVVPLSQIVAETNAELDAEIERIKSDHPSVDEIIITFDGSESNVAINNWPDVVSVFAVKTALADGDAAADVVTLDAARQASLKSVFWDMTQIDSRVEEEPRTKPADDGGDNDDDTATDETYTYSILHITVTSLDYREGAALYNFNDNQMAVLEDMMAPDNALLMLDLLGASGMGYALSPAEIAALRERLAGLTLDRQSLVTAALTLEGRVSYFWGGKSTIMGWDSRWGTPMEVTAAGSKSTGTIRPFGLDCSGFVIWSFAQLGVEPDIVGWGSGGQWAASVQITWSAAQPGDLAFFAVPGTTRINHVGIVASVDAAGVVMVVHCNSSRNTVSVTEAVSTGFKYVRRPVVWEE